MSHAELGFTPEPQRINRKTYVYPYVLRGPQRVLDELNSKIHHEDGKDVDVLGVCMGVKSPQNAMAANMLSPFYVPSSDEGFASINRIYDGIYNDTTLYMIPFDNSFIYDPYTNEKIVEPSEKRIFEGGSFQYLLKRQDLGSQDNSPIETEAVEVLSLPCISPRLLAGHVLNSGKSDIVDIQTLPLDRFREAIFESSHEYTSEEASWNVIESSSLNLLDEGTNFSPVQFTPEQHHDQSFAMTRLLQYLSEMNKVYKAGLIHRIEMALPDDSQEGNFPEPKFGHPVPTKLKLSIDDSAKKEKVTLVSEYKKLVEEYGQEDAEAIMRNAINTMQTDLYATWFSTKEREVDHMEDAWGLEEADDLKKLLSSGSYGTDILHIMPIVLQTGSEGHRTRAYRAFDGIIDNIYGHAVKGGAEQFNSIMKDRSPSTLQGRVRLMERAQKQTIKRIANMFGHKPDYVEACWRQSQTIVQDTIRDLGVADSDLWPGLRSRVHEMTDEVKNATIPELCYIYKFGDTPKLRFEAGRQLISFFHEVAISETYNRVTDKQNLIFSTFVDDYFGPQTGDVAHIGSRDIPLREPRPGYQYVKDEKPTKSRVSYSRKTWSKDPEKSSHDIYGYSLVLHHVPEGVSRKEAVLEELDQMKKQLELAMGDKYEVFISTETDGIDKYEEYMNADDVQKKAIQSQIKDGKNTGSNGNALVRVKASIQIRHNQTGETNTNEFVFYPYSTIDSSAIKDGFMGWQEHGETHAAYEVRRMMKPLNGTHGKRSLYDLNFPAAFYEHTNTARRRAGLLY